MQKAIISILIILAFICSCSKMNEKPEDSINEANLLWDGKQYTESRKAIEYLSKAIKVQPNNAGKHTTSGAPLQKILDRISRPLMILAQPFVLSRISF